MYKAVWRLLPGSPDPIAGFKRGCQGTEGRRGIGRRVGIDD